MKIYQVEELVGITKKNIRFYEDEGLLSPERDPENGYRDYSLRDVAELKKIKLLRKLSVPIEEIRLMQKGKIDFHSVMNNQIERLEKQKNNAAMMEDFCSRLKEETLNFSDVDAEVYLEQISELEKGGSEFMDITGRDIKRKKKTGAFIAALVFCVILIAALFGTIQTFTEVNAFKIPLIVLLALIVTGLTGIIIVLVQRFREIEGGEEDEAKKY
jgi:DNA-binding transcriptional MerR regulator